MLWKSVFKGLTYQNRRSYENAVEHYTEALRLKSENWLRPITIAAMVYNSRGEHDRAIGDFNKAIAT